MGLIGTLVGLVQMLGNLSDPSTVGPAMAVALITTFYGAILGSMERFVGGLIEHYGWGVWAPSMIGISVNGAILMMTIWNARPARSAPHA